MPPMRPMCIGVHLGCARSKAWDRFAYAGIRPLFHYLDLRTPLAHRGASPGGTSRHPMMYFTPLKTAVILGLCLLGAILCIPNLFSAPAAWLPWRQVHLGLDLRGGSYLLLEVDMKSVTKERLESTVDGIRQALRPGAIFYQSLDAQPDQNRILLRLRDATKLEAALAAIRPLISTEGPTNTPEFQI